MILKQKKLNNKYALYFLIIISIIIVGLKIFGVFSFDSSTKVMFYQTQTTDSWKANYKMLNGTISKNIDFGDEESVINIDVNTIKGSIDLLVESQDGEVILEKKDVGTEKHQITIKGKIKIKFIANKHKGNFIVSKN